jgi:hypothetical protein
MCIGRTMTFGKITFKIDVIVLEHSLDDYHMFTASHRLCSMAYATIFLYFDWLFIFLFVCFGCLLLIKHDLKEVSKWRESNVCLLSNIVANLSV